MQKLILNIEESRYQLLLQFLKTLSYVKIVQPEETGSGENTPVEGPPNGNQLSLLQQQLEQLSIPLFQKITDPVTWQKQQRDEWS